jgi:cytochrome c peroxidase
MMNRFALKPLIALAPIGFLVFFLVVYSCKKDTPLTEPDEVAYNPTPYTIPIPFLFPTQLNLPEDNPLTVEGIELGRYLFYDGRFGGRSHPDSLMTCGTCHLQERAFECNCMPAGVTGIPTPHSMMPLFNLAWNPNGYLWNGMIHPSNPDPAKRRLGDLCWMGVHAPHEMHSDTNRSRNLIASIEGYKPLFKRAFGTEEVTFKRMAMAVEQFILSIVSANSKFDQYLRGQAQLTPSELNGFVLFVTEEGADCFHCHGGDGNPLFTTNLFYNNAKDVVFNDPRDRYAITGNPNDKGAYRSPTLRNIELTGPYMHDGRFNTLDEVIDFYSEGLQWSPYAHPLMHKLADGGAQLLPQEKADLKAFLLTLTDWSLTTNPAYSPPASLPQ